MSPALAASMGDDVQDIDVELEELERDIATADEPVNQGESMRQEAELVALEVSVAEAEVPGQVEGPKQIESAAPPPQYDEAAGTDADTVGLNPQEGGATATGTPGAYIQWSDVEYCVPKRGRILNGVSGFCKPGQALAILGASGAGKTTLMDCLAGRKCTGILTGELTVNGSDTGFKIHKVIKTGYSTTETVFTPTLTVSELMMFAARFKLGSSFGSGGARRAKVNDIIESLGLTHRLDQRVGDELQRGLSSGEKKRLAVGMELINDPPVLFLDEPVR